MAAAKSNDNKAKYKAILGRLSDYFFLNSQNCNSNTCRLTVPFEVV